ncbi:MAG: hypothetical protein PF448_09775 [Bacteroidales bacterium]|jgi:hypothetical protein|nr:hypothetical protein [Bacteroidales bacterium]
MSNFKFSYLTYVISIVTLTILVLIMSQPLYAQNIIYSEYFEDANDVIGTSGIFGSTSNDPTDNNWSIVEVGSPGLVNSSDYCGVVSGKHLEWKDINGSSSDRLDWYSKVINVSASDVSISIDWEMNGASSAPNANFYFYYRIDGGSWVNFFTRINQSTYDSGTASLSGLSCASSIELKVEGWTGDASSAYERIDNIVIEGTLSSCTPPSTPPSGLSIDDYSSYSVDLSWTNNSGDSVLVVARKTIDLDVPPVSDISYTANPIFGLGQEIGSGNSGNFVVYYDTGASASITGLTSGLSYSFDIYTADGTCFNTTALTGSQILSCPSSFDPAFSIPAQFRTCGSFAGTEISNDGTLSFDIEVSGLTAPLDVNENGLRQVKIFLKNGNGEDLSQYECNLTSPGAKGSIELFSTGTFDSNTDDVQVTLRESSRLNLPTSSAIKPYDIGLYRISTAGDFSSNFDGLANANGTWTVTFSETASSTLDDIELDYIELEFGPSFSETDISNFGANCDNAYELVLGTYVSSNLNADSDDGNQPTKHVSCGDGITGCGCWNASYNEAQYLKFIATSTYFNMSVSGIQASSGDIQVIVVEGNPTPCSGHDNWIVMTCPESSSESTPNTLDGRSHTGNGSVENFDLSMDNAVIGNTYYIIIDGNSSATANYYIHVTDGVSSEYPLPVELVDFSAFTLQNKVILNWVTASEKNNEKFILQRSSNGVDFENIAEIKGHGDSYETIQYQYTDEKPLQGISYYRLKQVDFDGTLSLTYPVSVEVEVDELSKPSFDLWMSTQFLNVSFINNVDGASVRVVDMTGRTMIKENIYPGISHVEFDMSKYPASGDLIFVSVMMNGELSTQKIILKN